MTTKVAAAAAAESVQCSAVIVGAKRGFAGRRRCQNWTKNVSGRCHVHEEETS